MVKLLDLFRQKGGSLAVAESCTGGLIAKKITDIPGASGIFWGGFITYHNQAKVRLLGVKEETLFKYGAVSIETLEEMLDGVLEHCSADFAVAVTGIAGPDGGSTEKPVGTVWLGIAARSGKRICEKKLFSGNREEVREKTADRAVNLLFDFLNAL